MAQSKYPESLSHVLTHEGGYVNHPADPGGATNKGVTQAVYDSWRRSHAQVPRSVKHIEVQEMNGIYRLQYWDRVRGDQLPAGVDYAVFDFAVNSGVGRAAEFLQDIVNVPEDGRIGPATLAAVATVSPAVIVNKLCDNRLHFLRGLRTFPTFGKGWTRRVEGVRATALKMIGG